MHTLSLISDPVIHKASCAETIKGIQATESLKLDTDIRLVVGVLSPCNIRAGIDCDSAQSWLLYSAASLGNQVG